MQAARLHLNPPTLEFYHVTNPCCRLSLARSHEQGGEVGKEKLECGLRVSLADSTSFIKSRRF